MADRWINRLLDRLLDILIDRCINRCIDTAVGLKSDRTGFTKMRTAALIIVRLIKFF